MTMTIREAAIAVREVVCSGPWDQRKPNATADPEIPCCVGAKMALALHVAENCYTDYVRGADTWAKLMGLSRAHVILLLRQAGAGYDPLSGSDWYCSREAVWQNLIEIEEAPELRYASLRRADLEGADLSGTDLVGADLRDANLTEASLEGADLTGADLRGSRCWDMNARSATLREVNLESARLESADLRNADLTRANLTKAKLRYADLRGATLRGAVFGGADLDFARRGQKPLNQLRFDVELAKRRGAMGLTDEEEEAFLFEAMNVSHDGGNNHDGDCRHRENGVASARNRPRTIDRTGTCRVPVGTVTQQLPVHIVKARAVFGRPHFLVTPAYGRGKAWVSANRVAIDSKSPSAPGPAVSGEAAPVA